MTRKRATCDFAATNKLSHDMTCKRATCDFALNKLSQTHVMVTMYVTTHSVSKSKEQQCTSIFDIRQNIATLFGMSNQFFNCGTNSIITFDHHLNTSTVFFLELFFELRIILMN